MPIDERYYRGLIESYAEAERRAKRDTRRAWARAIGEVWLWTALGLVGIAFAFHATDEARGWVFSWVGAFVWVAGVSTAIVKAYWRAVARGDSK